MTEVALSYDPIDRGPKHHAKSLPNKTDKVGSL